MKRLYKIVLIFNILMIIYLCICFSKYYIILGDITKFIIYSINLKRIMLWGSIVCNLFSTMCFLIEGLYHKKWLTFNLINMIFSTFNILINVIYLINVVIS